MKVATNACPNCGFKNFRGHQQARLDVIVDSEGNWIRNASDNPYDTDKPYGPFTCVQCGAEYESLPIFVEEETFNIKKALRGYWSELVREHLDEKIHDIFSAKASDINNGTISSQLDFLAECLPINEQKALVEKIKAEMKDE